MFGLKERIEEVSSRGRERERGRNQNRNEIKKGRGDSLQFYMRHIVTALLTTFCCFPHVLVHRCRSYVDLIGILDH